MELHDFKVVEINYQDFMQNIPKFEERSQYLSEILSKYSVNPEKRAVEEE